MHLSEKIILSRYSESVLIHDKLSMHNAVAEDNVSGGAFAEKTSCTGTFSVFCANIFQC